MEYKVDLAVFRRIWAEQHYLKQVFGISPRQDETIDDCGILLAFAFPDRIAQRRGDGRYLLSNGRGAVLFHSPSLSRSPYLVAVELDDQGADSRIFLAAPVALADLEQQFGEEIMEEPVIEWDPEAQSVRTRRQARLGVLILRDAPLAQPEPDDVLEAFLRGLTLEGLGILPWTKSDRLLQRRLVFMHRHDPDWPDVSDAALRESLAEWLGPHLYGMKRKGDLGRLNLSVILHEWLSWEQRRQLDEWAPQTITVPSGSRIPVDYSDPSSPVLAVKLQELFGLQDTPRIAGGRVPILLHLLSPAQRPVQVTSDLASFWKTTYFDVKKDLKGRYPKHYWPDDPMTAIPTNRTRPRS